MEDIKQNYDAEGALFIRRNFSFHLLTNPSHLVLNWLIQSIIPMILQYSHKFNSQNVLGILDQISGRHFFGVDLDVPLMYISNKSS